MDMAFFLCTARDKIVSALPTNGSEVESIGGLVTTITKWIRHFAGALTYCLSATENNSFKA
jgi:hypothetical protein